MRQQGHLTPRQAEVIRLAAAGLSVKETARVLGVRPKTVTNCRDAAYRRLGVHNRVQAVVALWRRECGG